MKPCSLISEQSRAIRVGDLVVGTAVKSMFPSASVFVDAPVLPGASVLAWASVILGVSMPSKPSALKFTLVPLDRARFFGEFATVETSGVDVVLFTA